MAVIAIFSLGNFADAFLILRAQDLGVRSELIPIAYLSFNIVYAATSAPLGALADRVGARNMIMASFVFYAVVYAGAGFAYAPLHIWAIFPLYGVYKGMTEATQKAYLASIAPPRQKATAFGVYHTVSGLMLLPSSIIAGRLWDTAGPRAPFAFGAVCALAATVYSALYGPEGLKELAEANSGAAASAAERLSATAPIAIRTTARSPRRRALAVSETRGIAGY